LPVWARSCGRITAHYVHFSSQVTCEVLLHDDASFGVSVEIIFQRANLPTHGANRLDSHCIHVGWNAAQEKLGAHEITRDQVTKDMVVPRNPHFPADNQRDTLDTFAMLDQSLARFGSDPGPDAQNLQHFPRCQIPEREPANVLLFGRQFDRTTLNEKTP